MLFDTTVRRELARTFGATVVVVLTIVLTSFLIRTVGQAASGAVAPQDVVLLMGYVTLGHLPTILALSLFVAVVLSLGRMYRDSEMAVWFSSGVGLSRFVRPVLAATWPVLVVIAALLLFAWPWGNRSSQALREQYQQRGDLSRVAPGVFQSSSDGRRVFFVERAAAEHTQARNVFILADLPRSEATTSARSGRLETVREERYLVLDNGQRVEWARTTGEWSRAGFSTYRVLVHEADALRAQRLSPRATDTVQLLNDPDPRYQGELVWRLGLMLGAANLLLVGVGLSATNPRRASNWNLLFALLAFAVYYNLINLSQSWVARERLSVVGALLVLHGLAFLFAVGLIHWRDRAGVRWAWSWKRSP